MATHMKTTVDIPDSLFKDARRLAQRENTTLKALIEQGLRRTLAERKSQKTFHLRDARFHGKGLQPDMEGATWEHIRDLIYEGRGA